MGCGPGVTLTFASVLSEPGEYTVEAVVDGETLTCTAYVPLRRDGSDPSCRRGLSVQREEITTRSSDAISGRAGDSIAGIGLGGEREHIALRVARDGVEVLSVELEPRYRAIEVNGEGCGKCLQAEHTIGS